MDDVHAYNFEHFEELYGPPFAVWPTLMKAGDQAPDGEVTQLSDQRRVRLSEFWREGPLVLELGSLT